MAKNITFVYILKLEYGYWYIGKTRDIYNKYESHINGNANEWTKLHKPCNIYESFKKVEKGIVDTTTLSFMKKYGIDKVRGGKWSQNYIDDEQIGYINSLINNEEQITKFDDTSIVDISPFGDTINDDTCIDSNWMYLPCESMTDYVKRRKRVYRTNMFLSFITGTLMTSVFVILLKV